jgi:putative oxidoreductase
VNDHAGRRWRHEPAQTKLRGAEGEMKRWIMLYFGVTEKLSLLQSPFLLMVRLYWGGQFAQTGWGKMHNIGKIADFFMSLNIPFPAFTAHFIAGLEF